MDHQGHRLAYLPHPNDRATHLPVFWIHGLTGSVHFWEAAMYPEIREQRSWFSVSLPYHYPSTYAGQPSADELTEDLLADLLDRVIRRCVPEGKFHLIGYSVGGFTAMNYAAKYPDRVASVVSIGGFLRGRAKGIEGVLQFFAKGSLLRKWLFYLAFWAMQRHRFFYKLATVLYARRWRALLNYPAFADTVNATFADVSKTDIEGQRAWFRHLLEMDLVDETHAIRQPTLVIAGDRDPVIPYRHQAACAAHLPNASLATLPGVGHVPFAEDSAAFRRHLLTWLDKHG